MYNALCDFFELLHLNNAILQTNDYKLFENEEVTIISVCCIWFSFKCSG